MKIPSIRSHAVAVVLAAAGTLAGVPGAQAELLFKGDMSPGNLSQWNTDQLPKSHSGKAVTSPVREGSHALRIELRRGDTNRPRAEVMPKAHGAFRDFENEFQPGQEYWISFSVFLPTDWVDDSDNEIIMQMHHRPDTHLGEEYCLNPPLALYVSEEGWSLRSRGDSRQVISCKKKDYRYNRRHELGSVDKGRWTDWTMRIKVSHKSDGILEVWKDGNQVLTQHGPTTYNDRRGPYMKLGSYKWAWKSQERGVDRRVLYFDAVRIGNSKATFSSMQPGTAAAQARPAAAPAPTASAFTAPAPQQFTAEPTPPAPPPVVTAPAAEQEAQPSAEALWMQWLQAQ